MKRFKDVKVGESFYTSNGRPSRKISNDRAISLVPEPTGFDFQESIEDVEFDCNDNDHVYGVGRAKGYRL